MSSFTMVFPYNGDLYTLLKKYKNVRFQIASNHTTACFQEGKTKQDNIFANLGSHDGPNTHTWVRFLNHDYRTVGLGRGDP